MVEQLLPSFLFSLFPYVPLLINLSLGFQPFLTGLNRLGIQSEFRFMYLYLEIVVRKRLESDARGRL